MESNMLKPACEVVCFYDINFRLTVLINVSWSIRELESKVL